MLVSNFSRVYLASITTELAGIKLETCVFNAAGPKDVTLEELEVIAKSASSAITMKSCTLEPRQGNPEPRYHDLPEGSINSMGLPNLGYKEYIRFTQILKSKYKKPVVASISGLKFEDNVVIFNSFNESKADIIEFNPGSPNTIGKPTMGYDFEYLDSILKEITKICKKPLGIKLPPYFDFVHFEQVAEIIKKYRVLYISSINSIGNALVIDPVKEQVVIKPKGGFGGLGGKYIKYTSLANIRKFYEILGDKVQLVGCGGIYSGIDAFEFILAGTTAVQLGTVYMQEGPSCFERVQNELKAYMEKKGYETIEDFRGQLKTID